MSKLWSLSRIASWLVCFLSVSSISNISVNSQQDEALVHQSAIEGLFGQLAKTVIYGGASMARFNSRLLCGLLRRETGQSNTEQPTLFLFRSSMNKDRAYRIYSDDEITQGLVDEAQLDPGQATVILVHGWLGGVHNEFWLSEAKNVALKSGDLLEEDDAYFKLLSRKSYNNNNQSEPGPDPASEFETGELSAFSQGAQPEWTERQYKPNVIIVDWSEFAQGSLFTATQNSYKVARRLGRLLERLASVGHLRPDLMHCLGHSIGAHICGQAARYAFPVQPGRQRPGLARRQRMGRITGLDPGGFCYELGIRNESSYPGLRPSDALLTDAYYSNRSPFGNRFQVAQYNVRLNNGYLQSACSVWRNASLATDYFRASVRFLLGNIGHNDVLSCDHYFATRFAHQSPPEQCQYVAYACDSYRNFLRGRCGNCDSAQQCYSMNFEYQQVEPSNRRALEHIERHSSLLAHQGEPDSGPGLAAVGGGPPGGVPYEQRRSYYMRIADREPYCSHTYRVRLVLAPGVELASFRADAIQLQLLGVVTIRDSSSNRLTNGLLSLHGPWPSSKESDFYGLNNRTLTGLFELQRPDRIRGLVVAYDNERNRQHIAHMRLVDSVHFDYLSSSERKIKAKFSSWFHGSEIDVQYRRLDGAGSTPNG